MSWLLRVDDTLYFMQGGTNQYTDKVNVDTTSIENLEWFVNKIQGWLTGKDAPGSIQSSVKHPEKYVEKEVTKPPGTNEPFRKPAVTRVPTPNQSSRNGAPIKSIVLHYTTANNAESTISWFANPASQVSSHYLVGRDGKIWQFVNDANKAWHAAGANADTIGIENVCAAGQSITEAQSKALAALCNWLMAEYKIPMQNVTGHKFINGGTDCPGSLFGADTREALTKWIVANLKTQPAERKSVKSASLTRTGAKYITGRWKGLEVLELEIGDSLFQVCSGQSYAQNFRKPEHALSTSGNMEPIPEGKYTIGQIEWASGTDSYAGSWGEGLGPIWIALTAQFTDDRSAFGIHIDTGAQSTAGCVGLFDVEQAKKVVAALRKHDPKTLLVNWDL